MFRVLPRPHPDVVSRRLDDEVVLVQLSTSQIYSLNDTAGRAWELLSAGHDRNELERTLLDEFDVSADELRRELDQLFETLGRAGLLESS